MSEYQRPHDWLGKRCLRCGMLREWEGARYACQGVDAPVERARVKASMTRRKSYLRMRADPIKLAVRREQIRDAVARLRARKAT